MAKTYQISNNIIFSVNDDGSISKFASISESGVITRIGESPQESKTHKVWGYWLAIAILLGACVALFCRCNDAESNYRRQQRSTILMESKYNEKRQQLSTFQKLVAETYPVIISDIEIAIGDKKGNVVSDYGNKIYSSETMYLKPKITYFGLTDEYTTFKIKWIQPDGTLSRGSSSPDGFSLSDGHYIYPGSNRQLEFTGWGNATKGNWKAGNYRIEIWYNNTCLKSKDFRIY